MIGSLSGCFLNNNDYFFGQKFHLAESHAVAEIVYLASLRTTTVRAFLDRGKSDLETVISPHG